MPSTICSYADSASRDAISRAGPVISFSVNVSAAVLYSRRLPSCGITPALSSALRTKTARTDTPVTPTSPDGWIQISSNAVAR